MKRLMDLNGTNENWDINKTEAKACGRCLQFDQLTKECDEGISDPL